MRQVNEVVTAVHAFQQIDGIVDVVGTDLGLDDLSIDANVG